MSHRNCYRRLPRGKISGYSQPGTEPESGAAQISLPSGQSPFSGSVAQGKVTPEALPLTFQDAIDLGLKNNLGVLLQSYNTIAARGQKWKELSALLPNVSAGISENVGSNKIWRRRVCDFPDFPRLWVLTVYFDARVYLSQSILNLKALNRERGAAEDERAAQYSYKDARDLVVLATGNAYLQALAGAARVETAEAQLKNAQALHDKAVDQQNAGLSPAIDTLRARVEMQNRQQQLIVSRNDYAKQKLALVRAIGLPVGQEITLISKAPYDTLATLGIEESLQRAYSSRSDYLAAIQQVRAAEHYRKGAFAEHFPTLDVNADYGDLGSHCRETLTEPSGFGQIEYSHLSGRKSSRRCSASRSHAAAKPRPAGKFARPDRIRDPHRSCSIWRLPTSRCRWRAVPLNWRSKLSPRLATVSPRVLPTTWKWCRRRNGGRRP